MFYSSGRMLRYLISNCCMRCLSITSDWNPLSLNTHTHTHIHLHTQRKWAMRIQTITMTVLGFSEARGPTWLAQSHITSECESQRQTHDSQLQFQYFPLHTKPLSINCQLIWLIHKGTSITISIWIPEYNSNLPSSCQT